MLKQIIAGIILVVLGAAIAVYVPPLVEGHAKEGASIPLLTQKEWNKTKLIGSEFLIVGKVSRLNKKYDRGIVIGHREALAKNEDGEEEWSYAEEYRQRLVLEVRGVGKTTVTLDSTSITGNAFTDEREGHSRWRGVKSGQIVSTVGEITSIRPAEAKQRPGESLFVGSAEEWRKSQQESAKTLTYVFWALGAALALGGVASIVRAPSRRKG
jgi:hypothetical protein